MLKIWIPRSLLLKKQFISNKGMKTKYILLKAILLMNRFVVKWILY